MSADDVAEAHRKDLETEGRYGVSYLRYWVDVSAGKIFCLVEADDFVTAETATFHESADSRPCPHDTDPRNTDGTYWEFVPGLYVCHHRAE